MSYEFTSEERVGEAVRRIVREEALVAAQRLQAKRVRERDAAIHEVRKGVKRLRGLLRMMEPALGDVYVEEATAWRDLGRKLSALRDAGAMLGTLEEFRELCPEGLYRAIRRRLAVRKREIEKPQDLARVVGHVTAGLKKAEKRLPTWQLPGEGFDLIAPGLQRTYRRGFRALQAAQEDPSPDRLHTLRKRAKEHLYQLRLLQGLWDTRLRRHEARVRRLEEALGTRQNLAVLKTKILEQPGDLGNRDDLEKFLSALDERENKLTRGALKLAGRVYKARAERMTKLWKRWAEG
jgi:CHAD domain-containing protein